jgi:RHS repeat-associated protein
MMWRARQRSVAAVMLPIYFLTSLPPGAFAASPGSNFPSAVQTPKNVHVNKRKPNFTPYAGVQIPSSPTDQDITFSHAFPEPLLPVGAKTSSGENQALGAAIKKFLRRKEDEDVSAPTNFISQYPGSAWLPSLDLNLAEVDYRTGNFSAALDAWQDAWNRTQNLTDATGEKVANLAVAKLAKMKARIGRTAELDALFQQIKGRSISGSSAQLLVDARAGLWLMKTKPQDAYRCGPSALQELSLATRHRISHPEALKRSRSTPQGIALSDVQALAGQIDMPMQMARRNPGAPFLVPSVIHWKLRHYAALVGMRDGKYVVHDTTFGGESFLISAAALEKETSGYFLVATGALPKGWTSVTKQEGENVMGRGNTGLEMAFSLTPTDCDSGDSDCGDGGLGSPIEDPDGTGYNPEYNPDSNSAGGNIGDWTGVDQPDMSDGTPAMTQAFVKAMLVSLNLVDTPVRYKPPVGPAMHFTVQYTQRETAQPATFTYSNLGPDWTFSYLSYVKPGANQTIVYARGGGEEVFNYNSSTGTYYPSQTTQAVLTQINATTWQRMLPGGEIETYGQPDGSGNVFLSKITDPMGNSMILSYDGQFRLISLTDALGQVTTITYGNSDIYKITKVTDPFGRFAQFNYDTNGRLQSITDIIGITSSFTYSTTNFATSLTTPYGVTSFAYGDVTTDPTLGSTRWLEVTYPDGNKTRTEFCQEAPGVASTDPQGIPSGMYPGITADNNYLNERDTYFWDKQAMKNYPGNYAQAQVTHWLHTSDLNTCSDVQESLKKLNQNRIWYGYAGQPVSIQCSDTMLAKPSQKGRILDDGTTQLYQYQYNAIGKVTQQIDPLSRETDYFYASNNIDLLFVKQKNGSGEDLVASYTYNGQHEPLSATDASGQTTTFTYYPNGQVHTVTNAKSQTATYAYNANSYLTSVTGPVAGATTAFTYDGYGRVQTVTDSQGYVTTANYDAMDRPTLITYPDGTTSQMNYANLDLQVTRDRLGRWTRYFYNALRQPVSVMDSMGHVTTTNWTLSAGPASIVDASGHVTAWKYDGQERVIEKDYADGTAQHLAYENTTSRVKSTTDAVGQVATSTYNQDNTVSQVAYTNATVATPTVGYTYDPVYPRVATMSDGTGTTSYTYNPITSTPTLGAGRLGSVTTPLTTLAYTYDQLGRPLSQTIGGVASSVTYDSLGRVQTATNALSATAFAYGYLNNTGRVASVVNPNGQSSVYSYQDSVSTPNEPRLSEIKNLNASSAVVSKFDYGYDAQGQITSWTQQTDSSDPQNWALQYDTEGKLINANVTDTTTSAVLHQYAYLYDAAGNRTGEQVDGSVTGASYNNLNQLTGHSAGGQMVFSGSLSKPATVTVGGNAATVDVNNNFRGTASVTTGTNTVPVIATDAYSHVTTNNYQVVIPPVSSSYTYDLNGNLTSDGSRTFAWDAKNELVKITYADTSYSQFTYNGAGERVSIQEYDNTGSHNLTSTKQYVWAGGLAEERDATNTVTKRYFAQGEQRVSGGTSTNYFYTRDHLGSIREMSDASGTIQARYSYDPYGRATKVSGSLSCDFQYAGMYTHATSGLNLTMFRAYDPNVGRWISRDPSGEGSGLNLYAYCANSPINYVDPSGLNAQGTGAIDYDGDPHAYAPPGSGLTGDDYLSNATGSNGKLSSNVIVFSHGSPVTNSDGYYESKTSLQVNGQYVNAQTVSYVALGTKQAKGIPLGTVMTLTDTKTGTTTTATYADSRGNNNTGVEMSPEAARELGLPFNKHGVDSNDNITAVPGGGSSPTGTGSCMDSPPSDPFSDIPPLQL